MEAQTGSTLASIRGYGCYYLSLIALWEMWRHARVTISHAESIFRECVRDGSILDNDIPVGSEGWYRCYVLSPLGVFAAVDRLFGGRTVAHETSRARTVTDTPEGQVTIVEYRTKSGSHFTVARIEDGEPFTLYNPDPRVPIHEIRTVRHWRLT